MPFPCKHCAAARINGINCHETGCPDAWRDEERTCKECGSLFAPTERFQTCCDDACAAAFRGDPNPSEEEA